MTYSQKQTLVSLLRSSIGAVPAERRIAVVEAFKENLDFRADAIKKEFLVGMVPCVHPAERLTITGGKCKCHLCGSLIKLSIKK